MWTRIRWVLAIVAASTSVVAAQESCLEPEKAVRIAGVRQLDTVILVIEDPNPAERVTGYNIYRSEDPSLPRDSWPLIAVDATALILNGETVLVDPTAQGQQPVIRYYYVTALNGPCGAQGPRGTSNRGDLDGDGIGHLDDPCPSTPAGADPLTPGCAASDFILAPGRITQTVQDGLAELIEGATGDTPPEVVAHVESALLEIEAAATRLREATPCEAAAHVESATAELESARTFLVDLLSTLPGGLEPAHGHAHGPQGGTDGEVEWPSPEVLLLQGNLRSILVLLDDAASARTVGDRVCSEQGDTKTLAGIVHEVSPDGRKVTLTSGQQIVVPWTVTGDGGVPVSEDTEILAETRSYRTHYVADSYRIQPPQIDIVAEPLQEECVRMRVLPMQPNLGILAQFGWVRHPFDGYEGPGGRLELEAGMRLIAEEFNCPGVVPGGGPEGQDLRIDDYYRIRISYQPKTGSYIADKVLAHQLRGNRHVGLPETNPDQDAVLEITRIRRSCLKTSVFVPLLDHQGNVVGSIPVWECAPEEVLDQQVRTARIRDRQAYCSVTYFDEVFEIEDHEPGAWDSTFVLDVNAQEGAPTPLTFSAVGDRIVNGVPVHGSDLGRFESFAVYGRNGHAHQGYGTDNASALDWPHVTGERNGHPFRYTCSVPTLARDRIEECGATPDTFYRLPFPQGTWTTVSQGNGGTFSHNGWQWFALDLTTDGVNHLRASRGGTVIRVRKQMTLNCQTQTCTNWGFPLLDEYGNHVAIRHEDGTVGWYAHMVPESSPLFVDQRVDRGEFIGLLGNTGNSTGPHVHYHVTPANPATWGNMTIDSRYEYLDEEGTAAQTCAVPTQGSTRISTNLP